MRFALSTLAAGLVIAASASPAQAFGRGGFAAGGARIGPAGGVRTGGVARGVATGPFGGVHAGGVHRGSYTGPGGTTVQHAGGGGAAVGPLGGVHVGGGGATRVTGPGGNTYATGHRGGATVGPAGNVAAHGARGGVAVGPGGVVAGGSRGGAIATPWGVTAGGARGGVAVGPGGYGVAGGARVVGHTTGYVSPNTLRATANVVRGGYAYSAFTPNWYAVHRAAWVAPRWVAGYNFWAPPAWGTVAPFVGVTTPPANYDYGGTVVVNDDAVYIDGEPAGTPEEYAAQATAIADTGREAKPPADDEWQPLGVFGMIQPDEKVAQRIFQLAVNKGGVVRGNYYDAVADSTTPVYGSVDPKTQRAAWSIGEKKDIVFETGLNNLTKDESTVLIHYGKERTDQMMLVRLEEPKDKK